MDTFSVKEIFERRIAKQAYMERVVAWVANNQGRRIHDKAIRMSGFTICSDSVYVFMSKVCRTQRVSEIGLTAILCESDSRPHMVPTMKRFLGYNPTWVSIIKECEDRRKVLKDDLLLEEMNSIYTEQYILEFKELALKERLWLLCDKHGIESDANTILSCAKSRATMAFEKNNKSKEG